MIAKVLDIYGTVQSNNVKMKKELNSMLQRKNLGNIYKARRKILSRNIDSGDNNGYERQVNSDKVTRTNSATQFTKKKSIDTNGVVE